MTAERPVTASAVGRLRAATRAWHDALESTEFARALGAGTLPLDRYVGQLAAFRGVWAALEEASRADVWSPDLVKVPLIDADLRHFAELGAVPPPLATEATRPFADDIRRTATADPPALLGFLYVLEGSTLGALSLLPRVRAAYGLRAGGTAYYACGDRDRWARLTARLDAALAEPELQERAIAGALRAYRHIMSATHALWATRASPPDI